jgi:branched-chain amino acid transport system substrate-binding protein
MSTGQTNPRFNRRRFLLVSAAALSTPVATTLLQACTSPATPTAPAATSAAAPTSAPAPTAVPKAAAAPTAAPTAAAAPTTAPAAAAKTLKIGTMIAMSAEYAAWGLSELEGLRLWADIVNDGTASKYIPNVSPSGGFRVGQDTYKVEFVSYDTKKDAAQAINAANRLALNDKVSIVLGPDDESEAMSTVNAFFQANNVLHLEDSSLWYDLSPKTPLAFNMMTDVEDYGQAQLQWVAEGHPEIKRVAIVGVDWPVNRLGAVLTQKAAKDYGTFSVVYKGLAPENTIDFSAPVSAALQTSPDLIDMGGLPNPAQHTAIVQAAYQQGYKGKYMGAGFLVNQIFEKVPKSVMAGSIMGYPLICWDQNGPTEEAKWFYGVFAQRVGADKWTLQSPKGYFLGRILLAGIEKANSLEPVKIADAYHSMQSVPTGMGNGGFTAELAGTPNSLIPPQNVIEVGADGQTKVAVTYEPPFKWNHSWQDIPGGDEFKPNAA